MFESDNEVFTGTAYDAQHEAFYEPATEAGWVDGDLLCPDYTVLADEPDVVPRDLELLSAAETAEIPPPIDADIYAMTAHGIAVAEALATEPQFNNRGAEMSMRSVAALFNGTDAVDGAALAKLSQMEVDQLHGIALASHSVLGDRLRESVAFSLAARSPRTEADARAVIIGTACTTMQGALMAGPYSKHGYDQSKEEAVRDLVVQYARAFAGVYRGLSAAGHPKASDPGHRQYFATTILAATPYSMRPSAETSDEYPVDPDDYI